MPDRRGVVVMVKFVETLRLIIAGYMLYYAYVIIPNSFNEKKNLAVSLRDYYGNIVKEKYGET